MLSLNLIKHFKIIALVVISASSLYPQKFDDYFRTKIQNITEKDFWNSIRPIKDLETAIKNGKKGNIDLAYKALIDYHKKTLKKEIKAFIEQAMALKKDKKKLQESKEMAEKILRHEITGWHSKTIKFGKRIDFNANFGKVGLYGFHYLLWTIPLLEQYTLSNDIKYLECFVDIIKQYYNQRCIIKRTIPHLDPVYYELGASEKTRSILPGYALSVGAGIIGPREAQAFLKLILGFARSMARMQDEYRPGNWQINSAFALLWIGSAFQEFKEAQVWRKKAWNTLDLHRIKDFYSDGGHKERSWHYGFLSLEDMVLSYKIGKRYSLMLSSKEKAWKEFFKRAFKWFACSMTPSGYYINYGDGEIGPMDHIIDTAYSVIPEWKQDGGPFKNCIKKSVAFIESGYAFMRAGTGKDAPYMSINFGEYGGCHTHRDLLDYSIWCYGVPIIEEVGRFGPYDSPLNPFFLSEEAHNQVIINHMRMQREGKKGEGILWYSSNGIDIFYGWHECYPKIRVYRTIVFIKPHFWVINDLVESDNYIFQVSDLIHGVRPFHIISKGEACIKGLPSCYVKFANPLAIKRFYTLIDYSKEDFNGVSMYHFAEERHRLTAMKWNKVGEKKPISFTFCLIPFDKYPYPKIRIERLNNNARLGFVFSLNNNRPIKIIFNPQFKEIDYKGKKIRCACIVEDNSNLIILDQRNQLKKD